MNNEPGASGFGGDRTSTEMLEMSRYVQSETEELGWSEGSVAMSISSGSGVGVGSGCGSGPMSISSGSPDESDSEMERSLSRSPADGNRRGITLGGTERDAPNTELPTKGLLKNDTKKRQIDPDGFSHRQPTLSELNLQKFTMTIEMQLAMLTAAVFDKGKVQTMVADRYIHNSSSTTRKGRRTMTFRGDIHIPPRHIALQQAYEEHMASALSPGRLVFWTDASKRLTIGGFGVAWRRTTDIGWGPWETKSYKATTTHKVAGISCGSTELEGIAVVKAIDKACQLARQSSRKIKAISIYTDAQSVLLYPPTAPIAEHIIRKERRATKLGAAISLHWCPSHSQVTHPGHFDEFTSEIDTTQAPGNELADRLARFASSHEGNEDTVDLSSDDDDDDDDNDDDDDT